MLSACPIEQSNKSLWLCFGWNLPEIGVINKKDSRKLPRKLISVCFWKGFLSLEYLGILGYLLYTNHNSLNTYCPIKSHTNHTWPQPNLATTTWNMESPVSKLTVLNFTNPWLSTGSRPCSTDHFSGEFLCLLLYKPSFNMMECSRHVVKLKLMTPVLWSQSQLSV